MSKVANVKNSPNLVTLAATSNSSHQNVSKNTNLNSDFVIVVFLVEFGTGGDFTIFLFIVTDVAPKIS